MKKNEEKINNKQRTQNPKRKQKEKGKNVKRDAYERAEFLKEVF